jgi:hypothetical protein
MGPTKGKVNMHFEKVAIEEKHEATKYSEC